MQSPNFVSEGLEEKHEKKSTMDLVDLLHEGPKSYGPGQLHRTKLYDLYTNT
jgi:hypothetical protein